MLSEVSNESNLSTYAQLLIQTVRKKTGSELAITNLLSPDKISRMLNSNVIRAKEKVKLHIQEIFKDKKVTIIWDDTIASKTYAKRHGDINRVWNTASSRVVSGFQIITCIISDGLRNIPIDCEFFFSRKRFGKNQRTKSEIAYDIFMYWKDVINIERVLADAHYSTKWLLENLSAQGVSFCMKIPANRIVKTEQNTGQLKKTLRIVKNNRTNSMSGFHAGLPCFFYVVKYRDTRLYYISSDPIAKDKIASVYKLRWKIEEFHRTVKQSLGFNDCQSRSAAKQHRHMFYVIEAYVYTELLRIKLEFKNIEQAIHLIRRQNQQYCFSDNTFRAEVSACA